MAGDREVIGLLLEQLLQPVFQDGVIVDGFPRTIVQAETLKLFFNAMLTLREDFRNTPLSHFFASRCSASRCCSSAKRSASSGS